MNDNIMQSACDASAYLLLFCKDEVLMQHKDGVWTIPTMRDINILKIETTDIQYIGQWQQVSYYAASIDSQHHLDGFSLIRLKQLSQYIAQGSWSMAFRAYHIVHWLKNNKFCGRCGQPMQLLTEVQELAVKCSACSHIVYPRISPAIIVAVVKDDQILLAHARQFPAGRYSVIAGFVEPGETMENCVKREIQEEVGIAVDDIRYFGSQPWPFPDSLMVAFTASYVSGQITVDNNEILAADWFSSDSLPNIPDKGTISRQLIDWFLERQRLDV